MLTSYERLTMYALLDSGCSIAEISRRTGKSIGTVQKYKKVRQIRGGERIDRKSFSPKLADVKDFIDTRIKKGHVNVASLFKRVKAEGYEGSYGLLNSYVRAFEVKGKSPHPSKHVDHEPGYQAQMDWGSFGKIHVNGEIKRLYAFLYILSHSRVMYVEFVVKQNQATLEDCHRNAFKKLGIPKAIRYDNMKSVLVKRERLPNGHVAIHYNPEFLNFAHHYGFEIELCSPYRPQEKGKVEAGVKYLRYNFMINEEYGKTYQTLDELNEKARHWVDNVANVRIHKTTLEKPIDLWEKEKHLLRSVENIPSFTTQPFLPARVNKDAILQHKNNFYELPKELAQKKVFIRRIEYQGMPKLEIYRDDILVYTHDIPNDRGKIVFMRDALSNSHDKERRVVVKKKALMKKLDIKVPTRDLSYYDSLVRTRKDLDG